MQDQRPLHRRRMLQFLLLLSSLSGLAWSTGISAAQAMSLSLGGDRAVVVLFAGRGENPDKPIGLTKLNRLLQRRFGDEPERPFSSRVFRHTQEAQALSYLEQFGDIGSLGIIGYSWGGDSAIDLAKDLEQVNLLVQIDSVGKSFAGSGDGVLPASVNQGFNYFQRRPTSPGGSLTDRIAERAVTRLVEKQVEGSTNINVETLFDDPDITHLTIDDDLRLHQRIAMNVRQFLLRPLLASAQSPQRQRSTMALDAKPALASKLSSATVLAPVDPTTVPEPSGHWAILSLAGLAGLAAGRKRRTR